MPATINGTISVTESASATSLAIPVPTGVVAGEKLIAVLVGPANTVPTAIPTGWNLYKTQAGSEAGALIGMGIWEKTATGTETGSVTFTGTGTANRITGFMFRVGGLDSTTQFDATAVSGSSAAAATYTSPSITTVTANALLIHIPAVNSGTSVTITGIPTGLTQAATNPSDAANAGRKTYLFTETRATAGATGTRGWTQTTTASAAQWVYTVLAFRPSAATAPTVSAGADATATTGTAFTRTATENDNGSAITARAWTIVSGPTGAGTTIGTAAALSWTPTTAGSYVLRYSATNAGGTGTDDVTVTVSAASFTATPTDSAAATDTAIPVLTPDSSNLTFTAEGGTAGSAPTTSDTGSGTAFNVVTPGVGTITYDTAHPARGFKGLKFATTTAASPVVEWTSATIGAAVTTDYTRVYGWLPAYPTGTTFSSIVRLYSGTTAVGRVQVSTTGTLRYFSDASAASLGATTWTLPLNALFRLETKVVHAASGSVELRLFTGANVHGTTPDQVQSFTGNTGTNVDRVQFGVGVGNTVANYTLWLDEFAYSPSDWAGPATSSYADEIRSDTPVAFLTGQVPGTLTDQVTARTITISGTPTVTTAPDGQAALKWDGGAYAEVADANDLSVSTTGILTIEAWIRPDVNNFPGAQVDTNPDPATREGDYTHWIGKGRYSPMETEWAGRMYSRDRSGTNYLRANRISGYAFPPGGGLGAGSYFQDTVTPGEWIHWTLVIDTVNLGGDGWGTTTIYKNGVQRDTDTLGAPYNVVPTNTASPLFIGAAMGSYFTGVVDRIAIYNYRLPQTRIAAHTAAMVADPAAPQNYTAAPVDAAAAADTVTVVSTAARAATDSAGAVDTVTPLLAGAGTRSATDTAGAVDTVGVTVTATGPTGPGGTWTSVFNDDFTGTTLDTSKWASNWYAEGGVMNGVGTYARNVSVANGQALLQLESSTAGALIHTDIAGGYKVLPGDYVEALVYFPGDGSIVYNWPAFWTSGPNWPTAGEHDIAEVLAKQVAVNYHYADATGTPQQSGPWVPNTGYQGNAWHTYGLHRKASSADVYWDGALVRSYPTSDNGAGQTVIVNVGVSGTPLITDTPSQVKVDWVRAWRPTAAAPTPTLVSRVVDIPTDTTAVVKVDTTNATAVRLKVGTNTAVTTGVVYGAWVTPNAEGFAELTVTGLTPGTPYYYRAEMSDSGGVPTLDSGTVGEFRTDTAPGVAQNFTVAFGACTNATDSASLAAIAAKKPTLFLHLGDLFYADASGTTVANFRAKFDAKITVANHAAVFSTAPTSYIPSDHDGMNNNTTGLSDATAWTNWNTVYRERFPTTDLPASGVYRSFRRGRVRILRLDTRTFATNPTATDNATKTRLGTTQKQWFKDQITAATEPVILVQQADPWVGDAVAGDDAWLGYTTERAELGSYIQASGKKVVFLAGDMHALAFHNGVTGTPGSVGGIPVLHAAPLNNNASQKGGSYTAGPYPASGTTVVQQYGWLDVTDTGSQITLTYTGFDSTNVARITAQTLTYPTGVATQSAADPAGAADTAGTVLGAARVVADTAAAADTVTVSLTGTAGTRSATDPVAADDAVEAVLVATRATTDAAGAVDTATAVRGRTLTDTGAATDGTPGVTVTAVRALADTAAATDFVDSPRADHRPTTAVLHSDGISTAVLDPAPIGTATLAPPAPGDAVLHTT